MERPTLRQLEILAEVARIGTFRGAARHLGLSQVAVSDHIRQLESRLGCALFVRNAGSKPTLSPSGKIVLDHGRNVLFACDALISAARGAMDGAAGQAGGLATGIAELVVEPPPHLPTLLFDDEVDEGVVDSNVAPPIDDSLSPAEPEPEPVEIESEPDDNAEPVAVSLFAAVREVAAEPSKPPESLLPEIMISSVPESVADVATVQEKPITVASHPAILSRFQDRLAAAQEAFPDRPIAVDFGRFTPERVTPSLVSGRVDIALFYALGEVPGLSSDYLWSESWSLFARADHPLAQADMLRLADCVDMPMILFEDSNPLRALCEACLAKAGLWPAPTMLETDDFAAIATELLDYGEAVFPAFGVTAAQFAARQGLKRLALIEPLPGVQVRRATAPATQDDPTIAALAGLLG